MANTTIGFAIALVLLGLGSYFGTGMHPTALIPAGVGLILLICGAVVLLKPHLKKHVMHVAVLVAIIGFAGSVGGAVDLVRFIGQGEQPLNSEQRAAANLKDDQIQLTGGKVIRPVATYCKAGMAAILAPYVLLCIKSFVDARKERKRNLLQ